MSEGDDVTLGEISRSLARIEQQLLKRVDDMEQRLRRVERWAWALPPTFIIAVASVVAALVK
jgi:hypothetical protein